MKIIDDRDVIANLSEIQYLPYGCIFEFPSGVKGLYMKVASNLHDYFFTGHQGDGLEIYAMPIDEDTENPYIMCHPETKVLALETELHIKGICKYGPRTGS